MNARSPLRMTPDDYLAWEARQERKHELVGGVARLMAGASITHDQIATNLIVALKSRLKGKPCRAYSAEVKVRTAAASYRYPDATIDCGVPGGRDQFADKPTVLFEVLSPSTEVFDEIEKLAEYQAVESVQHIVYLSQARPFGRVWSRVGAGWSTTDADGLEAAILLPSLDLSVPLTDLYEDVIFEEARAEG